MTSKIKIHKRNFTKRSRGIKNWNVGDAEKKDVARFLEELRLGRVNKGRRSGDENLLKSMSVLRIALETFKKPSTELTITDIEHLEKSLTSDKIRNRITGQAYSEKTKSGIKKTLKTFLKWRLGDNKAHKLTNWLDTRVPKRTPNYLSEQ